MGVGHHVRVDIGGRVVLASCHRRLFARRIGLVPIRQSQRLAYDRGLAHGDPDRPEAATLCGTIHHSDRGSQYASEAYVSCLMEHHIRISMTEGYEPTDNAMAERQNGIFKVEWIYEQEMYRDKEQAINEINRMIDFYNNRRPHMSIGMECPMEVYKANCRGKIFGEKDPDSF